MNKVDGYGIYQQQYQKINGRNEPKRTEQRNRAQALEKSGTKQAQLSDEAKALLEELKKKYGNMDFIVADYSSDEQARSYLSRGSKEYSVLIEPELLEEMAADEDTKNKYLGIIDGASGQMDEIKEQLGDAQKDVKSIGFTVAKDGTVTYFADLEKSSAKQRERIEQNREEQRAKRKQEEKQKQKERLSGRAETDYAWNNADVKRTTVKAGSIKELIQKIEDVDWDFIRPVNRAGSGGNYDFSI